MKKNMKIAIIGPPNVGKSSFVNALLNYKYCIVSKSPHSTQRSVIAIYEYQDTQMFFFDTPGITDKKQLIYLNRYAEEYLNTVDLCLFFFDATKSVNMQLMTLASYCNKPFFGIFNKMDKVNKGRLLPKTAILSDIFKDIFYISSTSKENIPILLENMIKYAVEGEWLPSNIINTASAIYDQINDRAKEICFRLFDNEVPYNMSLNTIIEHSTIKQELHTYKKYRPIILGKFSILKNLIKKSIRNSLSINMSYELNIRFS